MEAFPPDIKAFLYYSTFPDKPRIAGELRLRVTSSDDPASFESGSDLLVKYGRTCHIWSRPLYGLSRYSKPLYMKLREEGIVPDDLDAAISTFPPSLRRHFYLRRQLYTFNDSFIFSFSISDLSFTIITEQGIESFEFRSPLYDGRRVYRLEPYTGAYTNYHLLKLLD